MASSTVQTTGGKAANHPVPVSNPNSTATETSTDLYTATFRAAPATGESSTAKCVQMSNLNPSTIADDLNNQYIILNQKLGLALTSMEFGWDLANNNSYFLGVFTPNILDTTNTAHTKICTTEDDFVGQFANLTSKVRLLGFDASPDWNGNISWSGSWGGAPTNQKFIVAKDSGDFETQLEAFPGMRVVKVQAWPVRGYLTSP